MAEYVLGLDQIDKTKLAMAGGKGANLGELSRVRGIRVPEGFCVTTDAYAEAVAGSVETGPAAGTGCPTSAPVTPKASGRSVRGSGTSSR